MSVAWLRHLRIQEGQRARRYRVEERLEGMAGGAGATALSQARWRWREEDGRSDPCCGQGSATAAMATVGGEGRGTESSGGGGLQPGGYREQRVDRIAARHTAPQNGASVSTMQQNAEVLKKRCVIRTRAKPANLRLVLARITF